jgi:predicted nucleic acid-binding protein
VIRVFVDSSVWIDHLRGIATPGAMELILLLDALDPDTGTREPNEIIVGDLVLLEVLRGIDDDGEYLATRRALTAFEQAEIGGTDIALAAVDHFRALRRHGITIRKAIDCLIAAWCIANGVPLLHSDRDFDPFARYCGLAIYPLARRS